ncbi:alpha-2-macroglobulin family protein [Dyadobacter chenhuakuii]|uniref:MG2 domain-containing protein n=1 Tax=Dyadobacter chenhuakuii TaxID=2909339 RepID=A0ABY4XJ32_9BACT|nr:MG2 domain-containing protein [Dyadobacter chenhuakuii]MCF2495947.1 MG2 domain-containing protein [Dyadobacter chenhuakuii]USJ30017.1 MG2 domain-containing protein [Dyadobacter chenhuakuii]
MKKTSAFAIFLSLFIPILFNSCSSLNEIRVAGTNFTDEISQSQNLIFTFNKDIVAESELNDWDSTQYVQFEPAVRGKFKWSAPNELVFSPVAGFGAATKYTAKLTDQLTEKIDKDKKLSVSKEPFDFHTPYLQLVETESWWALSQESGKQEARLRLIFNYPVSSQNVAEKLKVSLADKSLDYKILPVTNEHSVTLAISNAGKTDNNPIPVNIAIEKGLKVQNTSYISQEAISKSASLPSPLHLEIVNIKTGFENNSGYARIITTQELDKESIANGFKLSPEIQVQTEPTENGFIIRGEFNETETYNLLINKTLKGVLGAFLEDETSKDLFFGKMPASIAFANKKALYMTPKGSKNLGVQIVNIPKVQVKVSKLYANNILSYVRNNRWNEYGYSGDEWVETGAFNYSDDRDNELSDIIVDKTVETENLPKSKGISALNVALPEDNQRKGVYLVSVNSKDEAYLGATKLVSISDIGLIAKQGKDEMWIFANSIKTNEPLGDIEITLISSNNQTVHTANTNGDGILHIEKLSEKAPGFKIAMLTATFKEDFNYLILKDTQVETSRFEVEGLRDNASGLQAFIYGQRDIYRPGETMHFNTVIRTKKWDSAKEIPLKLRMLTPNGREYRTWRKNTNAQGAVAIEVPVDAAGLTGTYVLEVYNGNDILLASHAVSVEEFMPDRIKVDLSGAAKEYVSGNNVSLTATATNLFGPPASNRTYQMDAQFKRKGFSSAAFPEFVFDIPGETAFEKQSRQGVTNEQGQATESFPIAAGLKDIGVLEGKIFVTVFDENGRPVNRLQRFDVFTQPTFYGIRLPDAYVGTNAPVPVEIVGVNNKGVLKKSAARIEIVRLEYQTVVEKRYDVLQYTSRKSEKTVYATTLDLKNGKGSIQYVPTISGEYEVRVRRPGAEHYTLAHFYAYGYGYTQYSSFEVSNEGRVLMETDKHNYKVGESAKVLFKTPFDGTLLVTVERNNVLEQHILKTEKKAAELTFKLKEEHLPNVFITATLIRPFDTTDMPLTVAHGFTPILVEDPDRKLPVAITAIEKSRSKTKQQITIKTAPNAQVTLSVVDEGILQIKNSKTPDIHGHFYQKCALEVTTHDLYAQLFPELTISGSSSFGGDGYDLERRINPLSNGRTELVSFWSGILTANSSGEVNFDVDLPQFSGDLRIMAVAYKDNAFGSATKNMKVADPVVISAGLPRFLSPGDELTLPVNISNTESKAANATVSVQLNGPLTSGAIPLTQKMTILPGKEARAIFSVKALQSIGLANITVKVAAFGETFTNQTNITVRPASPLLKSSNSGQIAAGKSGLINLASTFIPSTSRSQIVLSRSPLVQGGGKALSTLLGYPYGCLEQTVSKAFPQIYFADLTKAMAAPVYTVKSGASDFNPMTNVQQAIRKVESLQLFNGGMTMWPGSTQEDWWATAYAAHFLEEARRAGFEINTKTLSRALDYLKTQTGNTANKEVITASTGNSLNYGSEPSSGSQSRKTVARREAVYSLYVLALNSQPNRASMNYYKQNPHLLTLDSKYLLAAAFQLAGDTRSFNALLPKKYVPENGTQGFDNSYSSPLRNMSLVLNTLIESDPDNMQIPVLARQLSKTVQSAAYLNTQEAAFSVLALGKLAKKTAGSTVTATVSANGKNVGTLTGKELKIAKGIDNQKVSIQTQGSGDLYWFSQSEGMSATGTYAEEDQGLSIRRQFLTRDGAPANTFKQNDLVIVKLTLTSTNGLPIDNIVITDMLPSGFEIENPRITEPRDMPWIKNASSPEYLDIRDDRIHFFTTANNTAKTFYYQVRIVSKGTFTVGPAAADAMYQGEYRSYSGGGKIKVE